MERPVLSDNDIVKLVKLVERKPEIWDKSCNKDNEKKRRAWIEILKEFDDRDWDVIPDAEKKKLEQDLTGKWQNLRDTFMKKVKRRQEQQYKNYESMKFLLKNFNSDPLPSTSAKELLSAPVNKTNSTSFKRIKKTVPTLRINLNKQRKRLPFIKKTLKGISPSLHLKALKRNTATNYVKSPETVPNNATPPETVANSVRPPVTVANNVTPATTVTNNIIKSTEPHHNNDVINPDESFFLSILPIVRRLSDDDKLEFRMGVLETLRNIRNRTSIQHL